MTPDTLVLGIDVGTSCLKAVLLDPDGNAVDEATASYGLRSPYKVRAQRVVKAHDD
jgi:sugar (pentulose or hexulose) kinase